MLNLIDSMYEMNQSDILSSLQNYTRDKYYNDENA